MAVDIDRTLGGTFYAQVGGQTFQIAGECTIEPSMENRTGKSTSGGKMYVTVEPEPARAKCKFLNYVVGDPMALFRLRDDVNITFVEKLRGIRHLFTSASVVGRPSKNLQNGECDGIEIVTDKYQTTGP